MFDNAERKLARIHSGIDDEISESKYNAVLGCCVIYGFLMNAFVVLLLGNFAQSIPVLSFIIGYIVSCVAGSIISVKSQNPVVSFIGYNLIVLPHRNSAGHLPSGVSAGEYHRCGSMCSGRCHVHDGRCHSEA